MNRFVGRLTASALSVPLAFLAWRVLHSFFAERRPEPYPRTGDGHTYIEFARILLESSRLDYYRVMRIVPSGIVHYTLEGLGLPLTNANILVGFEILNGVAIVATIYFVDRILRDLEVSRGTRELAFVLLVVSFPILKYSIYYPALTDMPALCLGAMLLHFHLSGRRFALAASTLVGAFTWPVLLYQGLILLALPRQPDESPTERPLPRWGRDALCGASAIAGAGIVWYAVFYLRGNPTFGVLTLDVAYLFFSVGLFVAVYALLPLASFERSFFEPREMWRRLDWRWLAGGVAIFVTVSMLKDALVTVDSDIGYGSVPKLLEMQAEQFTELPLITFVAHTSFFGCVMPLLLLFWGPFSRQAAKLGPGVVLAVLLNLYAVGLSSESRRIINLLPWFVVILAATLDRYRLPHRFTVGILFLNLVCSKVWLHIGDPPNSDRYKMSMGPWMSRESWELQIVVFLAITGALWFWFERTARTSSSGTPQREPFALAVGVTRSDGEGSQVSPWVWVGTIAAVPIVYAWTRAWVL